MKTSDHRSYDLYTVCAAEGEGDTRSFSSGSQLEKDMEIRKEQGNEHE